jgi:hypothetical protein
MKKSPVTSFRKNLSKRFFAYDNESDVLLREQKNITKCVHRLPGDTWTRIIIQDDFSKSNKFFSLLDFLSKTMSYPSYTRPRLSYAKSVGVQIWVSHPDDLALLSLMDFTTHNVREFSKEQMINNLNVFWTCGLT